MKFHIGQLRNLLGNSIRRTKIINIPHKFSVLYNEIRSWPPRQRCVAQTFYNRRQLQIKQNKVLVLDHSTTKHACALVCKLLWWFANERLTISRKSNWRTRLRFLNGNEVELLNDKNRLFKPFYSYCDIFELSLAKVTAPKATEKKRNEVEKRFTD